MHEMSTMEAIQQRLRREGMHTTLPKPSFTRYGENLYLTVGAGYKETMQRVLMGLQHTSVEDSDVITFLIPAQIIPAPVEYHPDPATRELLVQKQAVAYAGGHWEAYRYLSEILQEIDPGSTTR